MDSNQQERDEKSVRRGREAQQVLEHPMFIEAFGVVRDKLRALMESAQTDDGTLRAKSMLGLLFDVKSHLSRCITDGALAAETLRVEEQRKSWKHRLKDRLNG